MSRKDENILAWTLAIMGLLGAGFAAGLHKLIWGLFSILTVLWWWLCWYGAKEDNNTEFWWILAIIAPIIVGIIVRIIEGIAVAIFGALDESQSTSSKDIEDKNTSA